jgi:hypothetical protein
VLAAGFVIGLALWLLLSFLLGESEPWGSHGPAYPVTLLLAGIALGILGPGRPAAVVAGLFAGQLVALIYRALTNPASGETWMISVLLLGGVTFVVSGVGAILGGTARQRLAPQPEADRRVADRRSRGDAR